MGFPGDWLSTQPAWSTLHCKKPADGALLLRLPLHYRPLPPPLLRPSCLTSEWSVRPSPQVESSCYSSHGLESALDDYRRACDEAGKAVRAQLRKLAGDLQASGEGLWEWAGWAVHASCL